MIVRISDDDPTHTKAYKLDHDHVVLHNLHLLCPKCGEYVPLTKVGMRNMPKEMRNQPRCGRCR